MSLVSDVVELAYGLLDRQKRYSLARPVRFETHPSQGAPPLTLLGYPVEVNPDVPLDEFWLRDSSGVVYAGKVPE